MADERDDSGAAILERAGVRAVREALRAAGIADEVRVLGNSAAEQLGCPVGAIVNSLVFEADGEPLLAAGHHQTVFPDDIRAARHGDRWHGRGRGLRSAQRFRRLLRIDAPADRRIGGSADRRIGGQIFAMTGSIVEMFLVKGGPVRQ